MRSSRRVATFTMRSNGDMVFPMIPSLTCEPRSDGAARPATHQSPGGWVLSSEAEVTRSQDYKQQLSVNDLLVYAGIAKVLYEQEKGLLPQHIKDKLK
jgi:hypothetical protein